MSKMRVHELAKELNKTSKELLDVLEKMKIEVKSHQSVLDEEQVQRVKAHFAPKKKKRKTIIQVFNPQNSRMSGGPDERLRREHKPRPARDAEGRPLRRLRPDGTPVPKRPRPDGAEPVKKPRPEEAAPAAEHTQHGSVEKTATPATTAPAAKEVRADAPHDAEKKTTPVTEQSAARAESHSEHRGAHGDGRGERSEGRSAGGRNERGERTGGRSERGERTGGRGEGRSFGDRSGGRGEGRSFGDRSGGRGEGRSYGGDRSGGHGEGRSYGGDRSGGHGEGRSYGGDRSGGRGEGRSYGGDRNGGRGGQGQRGTGRGFGGGQGQRGGGRGGRLVMPERPTEAIERQTQKNERQNDRNNKRSDKRNDNRDRFDKRQNKAGTRSLQKHVNKPAKPQPQQPKEDVIKTITLPEVLTIRELAEKMKQQPSAIVKKLFLQGTVVTVNQEIDFEKAEEIALEFNCIAEPEVKVDVIAELLKEEEEDEKDMVPRVPVVCVMGHVDHGKTSLLDAIRDTHVTDREAGGITQHIGASVVTCNDQKITFLDTPGHEAFTAMRMRGANSTDIAVLVVAADDGVMPQTIEAISHAKAAGVEIIVAINKIDKPNANVEKVKQELTEYELVPEDWGGSTIFVPVSAHTHEGIDQLLEMILLTAEVLELKANPKRQARGIVIEGKLDKGKGPVANVLVQKGTLHVGDFIAAGACSGKVRAMMDDKGRRVKEAGPSMPVEVLGFNDVPGAGEIFVAPETDKEAKSFAETFVSEGRERLLEETKHRMSLDDLFSQIQAGNVKELNLIVKADVQGSVEAVKTSLQKLSNDEVVVKIIHGGVGAINESDVVLASASNAIIIGFNVRPDAVAKATAEQEGVDVRLYKVIYNAIEDVEAAMKGMLDPIFEEKIIGHAEVRQLFKASGVGTIAGAYVLDGTMERGCSIRIKRGDDVIFDGALASLKRFKDDVKEVKAGYECGLVVEKFNDIAEGDIYEAYAMVEVPR